MQKMWKNLAKQSGRRRRHGKNNRNLTISPPNFSSMPRNHHKETDQKVIENLKAFLKKNSKIILALSGGPDSVFLLECLEKFAKETPEIPIRIIIAHLNHKLRGKDSALDASFVSNLAKHKNLKFEYKELDIGKSAKKHKNSVEDEGRIARYEFFSNLQKKYKADFIATAHHSDDNLETILFNFVRGSGLKGLSGIGSNLTIIRPLLCVTKKEIETFLKKHKIKFRIDKTNFDTKIPRNFLRHKIIPLLEKINPNLPQTILKNSKLIKETQNFIEEEAIKWIEANDLSPRFRPLSRFDLKELKPLHKALKREIIRQIYYKKSGDAKNISASNIEEVLDILDKNIGGKKKKLGKYVIEINKGTFII